MARTTAQVAVRRLQFTRTLALQRRSRRIPNRAVRKAQSFQEPKAASMAFMKLLRGKLELFEKAIEEVLFPAIEELAPREQRFLQGERVDAVPQFITKALSTLELRIAQIFDEDELGLELEAIGERVSTKGRNELRRVVGVSIRVADPGVAAMVDGFRSQNVNRITSLAGKELVEITRILESSEAVGLRVEVLRKQIQERFGVTRSKAALLARDQTLTLNAQITRTRQQNAGVAEYIWTTSGDGRVRETHRELEGTKQNWNEPPIISEDGRRGHPGDDFQCRCTAFPVLPELV